MTGSRAVAKPAGGAWFIDEANDQLLEVDRSGRVTPHSVHAWPSEMVIDQSGTVWVSTRQDGFIEVLGKQPRSFQIGPEPNALALDETHRLLYVALATSYEIVMLNADSGDELARRQLTAEPSSIALFEGGLAVASRKSPTLEILPRTLVGPTQQLSLAHPLDELANPIDCSGRERPRPEEGLAAAKVLGANDHLLVLASHARLGQMGCSSSYGGSFEDVATAVLDTALFIARRNGSEWQADHLRDFALPTIDSATYFDEPSSPGLLTVTSEDAAQVLAMTVPVRQGDWPISKSAPVRSRPDVSGLGNGVSEFVDDGENSYVFVSARNPLLPRPSLDAPRMSVIPRGLGEKVKMINPQPVPDLDRSIWVGSSMTDRLARELQLWASDFSPTVSLSLFQTIPEATGFPHQPITVAQFGHLAQRIESKRDAELERGRTLFHDANNRQISSTLLACSSCHPDGREDGRTWITLGALEQTPMLAGRDLAHTAPYSWLGGHATLTDYIDGTIEIRLGGTGLALNDLKALARYVSEGLRPVRRVAHASPASKAGRQLFDDHRIGCAGCHVPGRAFTDGEAHNIGSLSKAERQFSEDGESLLRLFGDLRKRAPISVTAVKPAERAFDTPSLLQVGLTAPYLHDGSAATLDEIFAQLGDHMGTVSHLTAQQRSDLVAYLREL